MYSNVLILRVRMPISDDLSPRNFVTKISKYERVVNIPNSMSVLYDLLPVSIEMTLHDCRGVFNFTNPGAISHNEILDLGKYLNSDFDRSSFLKTDNSNEFSSSCTTRIVPILTTGVSFLRSYKVSNKRPIMGHPRSDLGCPRSVLVGPGQSQYGLGLSQDGLD